MDFIYWFLLLPHYHLKGSLRPFYFHSSSPGWNDMRLLDHLRTQLCLFSVGQKPSMCVRVCVHPSLSPSSQPLMNVKGSRLAVIGSSRNF